MMSSTMAKLIEEVMREVEKELASKKYDVLDDAISLDEIGEHEDTGFDIVEGVYEDRDSRPYEEFGFLHRNDRISTGRRRLVLSSTE